MNAQELKITIDTKPIAGIVAAELEKKGVVSVDGELFALGPVMPGDVKPTQSGWYARNYGNWRSYRDFWNGFEWLRGSWEGGMLSIAENQNLQWRGINVDPNAQAIADAMFDDARRLTNARNQAPPVRNPTPTAAPDTREANDLPRDYLDPEGFAFDFDGLGERGKVIAWALAAIIVVAFLSAWWAS